MSTVSIVTPVLNGERYLDACIESVRAQTFTDWEMLVIDDGSSDRTVERINFHAQQDSRIRLLFHDSRSNCGVSMSRQRGIRHASGEFVALLDADDIFRPEKLLQQLAAAAEHPDCVVFHCAVDCIDENEMNRSGPNLADSFNAFATHNRAYDFQADDSFLIQNPILNSSALIRKTALNEIHYGFEQLFQYEDWTLWVLLSQHGRFFVSSDPLAQYRVHESSASAAVMRSPLLEVYSYIEFLLSVLALCDQPQVRQRATDLLESKLLMAVQRYRRNHPMATQVSGLSRKLVPERLAQPTPQSPTLARKKRWYRPFSKQKV